MIRACNSGLVCGSPFRTRLTLLTDTPAWAATSRIVGRAGWAWRNDIAGLLGPGEEKLMEPSILETVYKQCSLKICSLFNNIE
jgi:hypothetical protein